MGDLDDILRQLEPSLGPLGGGPAPLEGGITNHNYRVCFGNAEYVVRLHGKDTDLLGISREAEQLANRAAAELGIAPAPVGEFAGGLVTEFVSCRGLEPAEIAARAEDVARALRSFHDSKTQLPARFDVAELVDSYAVLVRERGGRLPDAYHELSATVRRINDALGERPLLPCHNDLLAGNVISVGEEQRVMIVDWEYAGMGDPYFDLGNLAVNNRFDERACERLLSAYHGEAPSAARRARLALMMVVSDAREAAWGVMQGCLSELDFDFSDYAAKHLERLRAAVAADSFEQLLQAVA